MTIPFDRPYIVNISGTTPGTLAEHDMILSISEETINRQFQKLYDTPIEGTGLSPPPPIKLSDRPSNPATEHLINHELKILSTWLDNQGGRAFSSETGLFGHIKCPVISLQVDPANMARITFEFERRVDIKESPDSEFRYLVVKDDQPEILKININGWKFSWKVNVGKHTFSNIKELSREAANPESNTTMHPDVVRALDEVDVKGFSMSSIFCIFEDVLMANSFQIRDEKGNEYQDTTRFISQIIPYFTELQAATPPGKSTSDHPFVLGYGLEEKVPQLDKLAVAPAYFIPCVFRMTVTSGLYRPERGGAAVQSPFSNGTLNFCMLTQRNSEGPTRSPAKYDLDRNSSSGMLTQTFFDLTLTKETDGIIGIARDLIWDTFLADALVEKFDMTISGITQTYIEDPGQNVTWETEERHLTWYNGYDKPPGWVFKKKYKFTGEKTNDMYNDDTWGEASYRTEISWKSGLQTNRGMVREKDVARKVVITVYTVFYMEHWYKSKKMDGSNVYVTRVEICTETMIEISAGKRGTLDFCVTSCKGPVKGSDGNLEWHRGYRPSGSIGAWMDIANDEETDSWDSVKKYLAQSAYQKEKDIAESIKDDMRSHIGRQINLFPNCIMPAGNVFDFTGVDIDDEGNLYAHFNYALDTSRAERIVPKK